MEKTVRWVRYSGMASLLLLLYCQKPEQSAGLPYADIPEASIGKVSLFIMIGQSNMSGRGQLPETPQTINPHVFVFGNDYRWHYGIEPIDSPLNQVDSISFDPDAGYSIATSFAATLLKQDPELIVGFIPCAKGGSSVGMWQRNLSDRSLYGSCIKRIRAASAMGHIAGLLYCQGASDARDPQEYPEKMGSPFEWKVKFAKFVSDIRNDLGRPNLPVVFAQMGSSTDPSGWRYWDEVKRQQGEVSIPNVIMTTEADLPLDYAVHLTTEGYIMLGERFANAFLKITHQGESP